MPYMRAVIVLIVTMFALSALGQAPSIHKLGKIAGHTGLSSITRTLQRYKAPNTNTDFLDAWTEYTYPDCTADGPGTWSFTGKTTSGLGVVTQAQVSGQLGNGDCSGQTFMFEGIYYKWTAHNNHSVMVNKAGPTDKFSSTWQCPVPDPGCTNEADDFTLSVPVVRPTIHEMSVQTGWAPGTGSASSTWRVTAQCCAPPGANGADGDGGGNSDTTFSFAGEHINEIVTVDSYGGIPQCQTNPPPAGNTNLDADNSYPDTIGYTSACAIEQLGCYMYACNVRFNQQIQIQSPADSGFVTYTTDKQGWDASGHLNGKANRGVTANMRSFRGSTWGLPNHAMTDQNSCPAAVQAMLAMHC
jgi:hypothetical protein